MPIWLITEEISGELKFDVFRQRTADDKKRYPNLLSYRLLHNLATISGSYSYIRAGGSSGNLPVFFANQTTGVILGFSTPGADQPDKVSIGPSWYQSFMTFPAGTQYVYQVNYRDNSTQGVLNTIADAGRAFNALGSNLLAFELGNEVRTGHAAPILAMY